MFSWTKLTYTGNVKVSGGGGLTPSRSPFPCLCILIIWVCPLFPLLPRLIVSLSMNKMLVFALTWVCCPGECKILEPISNVSATVYTGLFFIFVPCFVPILNLPSQDCVKFKKLVQSSKSPTDDASKRVKIKRGQRFPG